MVENKDLQEKMLLYRLLESRLDALGKQKELLSNKVLEIVSTLSSIEELEKNQNGILFKLGSEAYTFANITETNKILVEIGAGIALEKNIEDAKKILNERKGELEEALKEIQNNASQLSIALNQITPEINELIQKQNESIVG